VIPEGPSAAGSALRFEGTGSGDVDRVKVRIDPGVPADVGASDFTLEFWIRAEPGENDSDDAGCGARDGWITGNIVFDRDIWGEGDHGDFGVSLSDGAVVFGVDRGGAGTAICGRTDVADGVWHHVAATRSVATGQLRLFVDGRIDAEGAGPAGDVSYRDGRPTKYPNDPYFVIGAEKHDAGREQFPSFRGWLDEVRLSTALRYTAPFTRPISPFQPDEETAALWHFDEGSGEAVADSAPGGRSAGVLRAGGPRQAPKRVTSDAPLVARRP
jgi:hypothetical protein